VKFSEYPSGYSGVIDTAFYPIFWSSHDILRQNGDVYFEATPAINAETGEEVYYSPVTPPTLDPKSLLMGYRVGQMIRSMRSKKEPVAYLYGEDKVRLPAVPEHDEEYSYYTIFRSPSIINLYLTNYPGIGELGGISDRLDFKGKDLKTLSYRLIDGVWQDPTFGEPDSISIGHRGFIFTNYPLYDSYTGDLILPKSEPIPVYE
jgi:hypothetical protein